MTVIPNPRSHKRARIEIIPLIDVVFFLLATFVMVSLSMVKNQGISVNLPAAKSSAPQSRESSVVISVTAEGEVYLNKEAVTIEKLVASLKDTLASNPDPKVFINGDKEARFGKAIEVLDEVRKLGITHIAIQTEPAKPVKS
jgi:biopolymer transport protein ExbD